MELGICNWEFGSPIKNKKYKGATQQSLILILQLSPKEFISTKQRRTPNYKFLIPNSVIPTIISQTLSLHRRQYSIRFRLIYLIIRLQMQNMRWQYLPAK